MSAASHYQILGLSDPRNGHEYLTVQKLKAAYRTSLLLYHPDKARADTQILKSQPGPGNRKNGAVYSIDQITQAYAILSVPKLKAQYDRDLLLSIGQEGNGLQEKEIFRTGVEVVDLDDLAYNEDEAIWYRSCRCGDEKGFLVREEDLEEVADDGEINVGCRGCSLWMKVLFGVVEDQIVDTNDCKDGHG